MYKKLILSIIFAVITLNLIGVVTIFDWFVNQKQYYRIETYENIQGTEYEITDTGYDFWIVDVDGELFIVYVE